MRRFLEVLTLSLLVAACVSSGDNPSTSGTTTPSKGVSINGLTCPRDITENSIADYGEDAQGFDTISGALAEFMDFEGKYRPAWGELTAIDPNENPVEFENDRGWVMLRVQFSMLNGGWLYESFEACADSG